jgi:hypothetical protein
LREGISFCEGDWLLTGGTDCEDWEGWNPRQIWEEDVYGMYGDDHEFCGYLCYYREDVDIALRTRVLTIRLGVIKPYTINIEQIRGAVVDYLQTYTVGDRAPAFKVLDDVPFPRWKYDGTASIRVLLTERQAYQLACVHRMHKLTADQQHRTTYCGLKYFE